jgi:hypothetical protein
MGISCAIALINISLPALDKAFPSTPEFAATPYLSDMKKFASWTNEGPD